MRLFTFKKGGIHPPESKLTSGKPVIEIKLPKEITLNMSQSIGAPAICRLKKGDHVCRGQIIGEANGFVSANVHTPISGVISKIEEIVTPYGKKDTGVTITADDNDHFSDLQLIADTKPVRTDSEIEHLTSKEVTEIIGDCGIVGLGGATFPTRVKLSPPPGMNADTLIVNGAECEPYLTCDEAIMLSQPSDIVEGIKYLMKAAGVNRALVGIENNKTEAIRRMKEAAHRYPEIQIMACKIKYPEGSEKQMIEALTGRYVAPGALPISVGVIVDNVATVLAVYHAVKWGLPLTERVITVTGKNMKNPGNYLVPIGTNLKAVVEIAGGIPENTGKIISGGPMMGRAIPTIDIPMTKGTSGLVFMDDSESSRSLPEPCVRCARCVDVCPMGLEPYLISTLSRHGRFDDAEEHNVADCIECGSCTYICPSSRPILDFIRVGKSTVISKRKKK